MRHPLSIALLGLTLLTTVSGCGGDQVTRPKTVPVTGTITRAGKPVENAYVSFMAKDASRAATGQTNAEGKFVLGTFDKADGAVAGDHVVTVTKVSAVASPAANMPPKPEDLAKMASSGQMAGPKADASIPAKYTDSKTTTLKATVKAEGPNDFPFDLVD